MISALSHLRISSFTASHTLGLSHLWAFLTGLNSSSRKMRWVQSDGSSPFRSVRVHPIASSFRLSTSSNCSSCFISSLDEIITGFAFSSSRKAYLSVDGRVLSSKVGSSRGSSSYHTSSSIIMTSSRQASISWSSTKSIAPKSSEAREGYFINLLMSTFTVCSPTLRINSPFPQLVTAFVVARKGRPKMIWAWLSS